MALSSIGTNTHTQIDTALSTLNSNCEKIANKDIASGYAGLDENVKLKVSEIQ